MRKLKAVAWLRLLLPGLLSKQQCRMRSSFCWFKSAASIPCYREQKDSKPGSCTRSKVKEATSEELGNISPCLILFFLKMKYSCKTCTCLFLHFKWKWYQLYTAISTQSSWAGLEKGAPFKDAATASALHSMVSSTSLTMI